MSEQSSRPREPALSGRQRRQLRALAHALRPLVQVGETGMSEGVIGAVDAALEEHELVKVRLMQPLDKKVTAAELAVRTDSNLCGLVGHTVILYRRHPERPRIELS